MATVYRCPVPEPEWSEYEVAGKFSHDKMAEVDAAYIARCKQWLNDNGFKHKLTGEIIRFPVADGYAQYMVMDGTKIMHLPLMDAYSIPAAHARGLRVAEEVKSQKAFRAIFAKPRS